MKIFKKAFTLVELVVVVAIIAILSGISVAAYSGITARTKMEADKANVSEWNTLLKVETVEGKLDNIIEVKDYFKEQGFGDSDFIPRSNGYGFYYCESDETMYMVDDSDSNFDVSFPEDTNNIVSKSNSYRLNNQYCYLTSSVDGLAIYKNVLTVGQDNVVALYANPMPLKVTINGNEYFVSDGKITINPLDNTDLNIESTSFKIDPTAVAPTKKTNLIYNGSAQALINEGTTNGGTWNYKLGSGSYSSSVPTATDAGTYTIYYKLVGNATFNDIEEQSFNVSIGKATATTTAPTAITGLVYNKNSKTLVNDGTCNAGDWYYKVGSDGTYSTTLPSRTSAGTYTIYYKYVGGNNYNDISEQSFDVTISKATPVVTAPTAKTGLKYSPSAWHYLINRGSTTYGTMKYRIGSGSYSTSIPQACSPGDYYVYYKAFGDSNIEDSAEKCIVVTINKGDPSISAPSISEFTENSVTLVTDSATEYGSVSYGINTTNTTPTTWQSSTTFTSLNSSTQYYFFKKYAGNDYYNSAVSTGTSFTSAGYNVSFDDEFSYTGTSYGASGDAFTLEFDYVDNTSDSITFTFDNTNKTFITDGSLSSRSNVKKIIATNYNINGWLILYYKYEDNSETISCSSYIKSGNALCNGITLGYDIVITELHYQNCIDDESLITMADGSTKPMKNIEVGDEVLSIDFDSMKLVSRKVIYSGKNETDYDTWKSPCYFLHTFSDGTKIKRAMRHRFYCLETQGYKHMDDWTVGLHGYHQNGTNPYLVSTTIEQDEIHYGRITLEGSNNYFANGLSTGDSECCPNKVTLNSLLEKGF